MKKQYSKPRTDVVTFSMETFMAASNTVTGTNGINDVTISTDKPSDFSKDHDNMWDFSEEN